MSDTEIVVSEEHEALLRTALKVDPGKPIPRAALEMYDELRTTLRRLGCGMSVEFLALVPVLTNRVARPNPLTFTDQIKESAEEVKYGTRVVAKWRNKWRAGRFIRLENERVVVVIDDDTAEERKLGLTNVRLATKEDLAHIGETK